MRRLVYRNILGNNPRKHEVSIEETSDRFQSKIFRKLISKYFLTDIYRSESLEELARWIRINKENDSPRDCHVMSCVDSKTGESKIVCKVLGTFYVVHERMAYKIVYINEVKIHTANEKKVKNEGKSV